MHMDMGLLLVSNLAPNLVSKLRNEFSANMYINLAKEITLEFVSELKQGHGDDYPIT